MILAQYYRKHNIGEYILYMWQVEDTIRSYNFDLNRIYSNIIAEYKVEEHQKEEIKNWYAGLIDLMKEENIKEKGHLQMVKNIINDLHQFHLHLSLEAGDKKIQALYSQALININLLKAKMDYTPANDVEVCFVGLYAYLLMKLQKKEISSATTDAMNSFSKYIAYLSAQYLSDERGENN